MLCFVSLWFLNLISSPVQWLAWNILKLILMQLAMFSLILACTYIWCQHTRRTRSYALLNGYNLRRNRVRVVANRLMSNVNIEGQH
ncbi:uncharacterized protein Dyak_GE27571 [Drosophila yakuba]|uniref:Uncharacterized protein n=1 Tax=Drosophila yakuba TaxID=7245 RepID=A0A0R1DX25_DROYA|nr:uncharacterized protein Dyak_GE27571 [Drosophila yakuba]